MYKLVRGVAAVVCAVVATHSALASKDHFGTAFTPAQYPISTDDQIFQALQESKALGNYSSYLWDWGARDDVSQLNEFVPLLRAVGLKPFIQLSPTALGDCAPPKGLEGKTFGDAGVRSRYLADVDSLAALQPEYLNLAAEINLMAYRNPEEFVDFKSLYRQAYTRVKTLSPNTKVGISLHMDLFFGDEEYTIMNDIPHDYVGFTSYPAWTVHKEFYDSPDEILNIYYDRIRSVYPDDEIVFTEMGWPSAGNGNLEEQADFVRNLPRLLAQVQPELVLWALQHDVSHYQVENLTPEQIEIIENFGVDPTLLFDELNSTGLLSWHGPPKPAYFEALNLDLDYDNTGPIGSVIPEPASISALLMLGMLAMRNRRQGRMI